MAGILPRPEKQRESGQKDWQTMARRRYQKGSIRKRGTQNPVWELLWRQDFLNEEGKLERRLCSKILGFTQNLTLKQARRLADEHLRPLNEGYLQPHVAVTLHQFVDRYFVPNFFPTIKLSTQKKYRCALKNHLLPAFGEQRLSEIGTLDMQTFVLQKMDGGLGWESADLFRNLLSKVFATAKKWGYHRGENPAADVDLPQKTAVREKHVLLPAQVPLLLAELREPVRTMALVALNTGLRVGELLGLRWMDLDFQARCIRVEQAIYRGICGTPKTKGSKRTLPLPSNVLEALTRLYGQSGNPQTHELVFHTRTGTAYGDTNLLHRHLKPAGTKIGAPWLSWHSFRRTHATLIQLAGGSLKDAQAQMGHTKMSTTLELYTVPLPDHQRDVVEKLSELLTSVDEQSGNLQNLPMPTEQVQ